MEYPGLHGIERQIFFRQNQEIGVLDRCKVFGKDGGFIFNAVHNIQANVPTQNVVALFDAFKEFHGARG